jgi:hypothetical protein
LQFSECHEGFQDLTPDFFGDPSVFIIRPIELVRIFGGLPSRQPFFSVTGPVFSMMVEKE